MPKLLGVNLVGVILAALAIFMVGFIWYGVVFADAWMTAAGNTEADYAGQSPLWMAAGLIMPLVIAFGLGLVKQRHGVTTLKSSAILGFTLALLLGVPVLGYTLVYMPDHSTAIFLIDAGHTLIAWTIGAIVLSFFD
jgi:hypothetical protein